MISEVHLKQWGCVSTSEEDPGALLGVQDAVLETVSVFFREEALEALTLWVFAVTSCFGTGRRPCIFVTTEAADPAF